MLLKDVIVINILLILSFYSSISQKYRENSEVINCLSNIISTHNNDSIVRLYNKPLEPSWDKLLNMSLLERNIIGRVDSNLNITPFDPLPIIEFIENEDLVYMKNYSKSLNQRKWKGYKINNNKIEVIRRKPKLSPFQNRKNIKDFIEVSLPVFSRNKKIAILQVNRSCGMECGEGILLIIQYKNGKWERLCHVTLWVS